MALIGQRIRPVERDHRHRPVLHIHRPRVGRHVTTRISRRVGDRVNANRIRIDRAGRAHRHAPGARVARRRPWVRKCRVALVGHRVGPSQRDHRHRPVLHINRPRIGGRIPARITRRVGDRVNPNRIRIDRAVRAHRHAPGAGVARRRARIRECRVAFVGQRIGPGERDHRRRRAPNYDPLLATVGIATGVCHRPGHHIGPQRIAPQPIVCHPRHPAVVARDRIAQSHVRRAATGIGRDNHVGRANNRRRRRVRHHRRIAAHCDPTTATRVGRHHRVKPGDSLIAEADHRTGARHCLHHIRSVALQEIIDVRLRTAQTNRYPDARA